jgi:adenylate kinase
MIHLILFGPPGSGKGTQAAKLVERYNLEHISTGDLFRYEIGNQTELGQLAKSYMDKGQLVPDFVTINMLRNRVNASPEAQGFIYDGFPRTGPQAKALDELLASINDGSVTALIKLEVEEAEIVARLVKRGETSGRPDDKDEEIIRNRFRVYQEQTAQVYEYYNLKEVSHTIEGVGSVDEIFVSICSCLDSVIADSQ